MSEVIQLGRRSGTRQTSNTKAVERGRTRAAAKEERDHFRFLCSKCQKRVKARYGQEGKQFNCPFCQYSGTIPYPSRTGGITRAFTSAAEAYAHSMFQRRILLLLFCLFLLCVTYTQQKKWMPLLGLVPPQPEIPEMMYGESPL